MLRPVSAPPIRLIGVGIDTARYGHHITFLRDDRQPATSSLSISESRAGYDELRQSLQQLRERHPEAHFHVRIDAAGQYATNLEQFLRGLCLPLSISLGEPNRNKSYREAHFPKRKSDATDSHANARFAVVEQPAPTPGTSSEVRTLCELVEHLDSQSKETTRLINQLHNLLARVFPELALLAPDVAARSILKLLKQYPTPAKISTAQLASLAAIPYLSADKAKKIQEAARTSIGSFQGDMAGQLVRDRVIQIQTSQAQEKRLAALLTRAFALLPPGGHNHLCSIPGVGQTTAAVLAAKIVQIDRFPTPMHLVSYFGIFPEERSSGVNKAGTPLPVGASRMSPKGNDLVRKYLWHAARTGILYNPAIRTLYARQRARGKRGDVALGHCMRKLLHLVFAVWKTAKPFDASRYASPDEPAPRQEKEAAGRNQAKSAQGQSVTAATGKLRRASRLVKQVDSTLDSKAEQTPR